MPSLFKLDNKDLLDPRQIAEQFCIYFTNIGPSLARNIPVSLKSHRHFHYVDFNDSLNFDEISEHEVVNICGTLRSEKATGFDNISTIYQRTYYLNLQYFDSYL